MKMNLDGKITLRRHCLRLLLMHQKNETDWDNKLHRNFSPREISFRWERTKLLRGKRALDICCEPRTQHRYHSQLGWASRFRIEPPVSSSPQGSVYIETRSRCGFIEIDTTKASSCLIWEVTAKWSARGLSRLVEQEINFSKAKSALARLFDQTFINLVYHTPWPVNCKERSSKPKQCRYLSLQVQLLRLLPYDLLLFVCRVPVACLLWDDKLRNSPCKRSGFSVDHLRK